MAVFNGRNYSLSDFTPYNYAVIWDQFWADVLAQLQQDIAAGARDQARAYAASAQTAQQLAQAAVAQVTVGSTNALSFPPVDKRLVVAADVVDVFVYDTRQDSDGGAWRLQCQHTGWYQELLNTATRGVRRDFPALALVVAHLTQVVIYDGLDLDSAGLPRMWAVIQGYSNRPSGLSGGTTSVKIRALNGRIWLTSVGDASGHGLIEFDFPLNRMKRYQSAGSSIASGGIEARNVGSLAFSAIDSAGAMITSDGNHIDARVLPGAPRDGVGLPIPHVLVSTASGGSLIRPAGTVVNITRAGGYSRGAFLSDNRLALSRDGSSGVVDVGPMPTADVAHTSWLSKSYAENTHPAINITWAKTALVGLPGGFACGGKAAEGYGLDIVYEDVANTANGMVARIAKGFATGWMCGDVRGAYLCDGDTGSITGAELVTNGLFVDGTSGWTVGISATINVVSGKLEITSTGNGVAQAQTLIAVVAGQTYSVSADLERISGRQSAVLQVSGTVLEANVTGTQAVVGTALVSVQIRAVQTGTATITVYEGNSTPAAGLAIRADNVSCRLASADRSYKGKGLGIYGTWIRAYASASSDLVLWTPVAGAYMELPPSTDFDVTGDWALPFLFRCTSKVNAQTIFNRRASSGAWLSGIIQNMTGQLRFGINDGTLFTAFNGTSDCSDGAIRFGMFAKRGAVAEIWVNGVLEGQWSIAGFGSLANPLAPFRIGLAYDGLSPADSMGFALLNPTNYAPTPAQIRKMATDTLARAQGKGLLGGASDAVSSLSWCERRRVLAAGTGDGTSLISGISRTAYYDESTLAATTSDAVRAVSYRDGILLIGTAAEAGVLQEAVVGKEAVLCPPLPPAMPRHIAIGVTTDATPLDLSPRVSVGVRELVLIEAVILGRVYGASDTERLSYIRKGTYYRDAGGNVTLQGSVQTIGTDTEVTGTADATLQLDTVAQTVTPRVTGVAGKRISWSAHITVSRISEEQGYA